MKKTRFVRMIALAGLAALAVFGNATAIDQTQVKISKPKNTTINVKFAGSPVAIIEIRLNGVSVSSRRLQNVSAQGEEQFELDIESLHDGDNQVEVRLFDADGKMIGTEKTLVTVEVANGPIFLNTPKMGATVQGPVEITVGLGREFKSVFVSFFVDNQFRAMQNTLPYSFVWDTEREANGWHEIEAWVVDENNATLKTKKTKVFVNNPGGRTERVAAPVDLKPIGNTSNAVVGAASGLKSSTSSAVAAARNAASAVPSLAAGRTMSNPKVSAQASGTIGIRTTKPTAAIAAGSRLTTPTASKPVVPQVTKPVVSIKASAGAATTAARATKTLAVTYGTRLPVSGPYDISVNGTPVSFDVAPRVENGIPLTPFRHLFEQAGGEVEWSHASKSLDAKGDGNHIYIKIGDKLAKVNSIPVELELAPFIERGRTVVPLSFLQKSLNVDVTYDPATGHVVITSKK
ncbi:MAG TPA: stalk domain-containing protein [Fimbriimonadaceae bacterium]|nr:stalk domain-containing protein [Fimbriimonadaceae bacterium]